MNVENVHIKQTQIFFERISDENFEVTCGRVYCISIQYTVYCIVYIVVPTQVDNDKDTCKIS